ncbi:MAG: hypothetical protein R6V54_06940 [Desulfobacteraceae bacterium]
MTHTVTFFSPCPLTEGQKIRIEESPLAGDWEVIAVTRSKITLRCPLSGKELTKDRLFCFTEEKQDVWPKTD